ncbi:hypothetical protein CAEBREN_13483 [Caenorhabditis brenneri]|uniref:Uncharacterized protein n=1 Tax=Caenorhabditis brenneri TaxID=135651 RepID=G0MWY1_CAEBE|nr:hypothetical protein CAEBREN_13483 [Caenorhabditis brenneri]
MRLFVLLVAAALFKSGDSATIKVEFGIYCPDKTIWEYKIKSQVSGDPAGEVSFKTTDHFEFRTLDNEATKITHLVEDTCTADEKWQTSSTMDFSVDDKNVVYFFIALNLKSKSDTSAVYEKLFVHYLQKECPTGDCSAIRDRILASCKFAQDIYEVKICTDNFEKALKVVLENRFTSTQTSMTIIFIIIGSVVGVVLLISLIVTYFICKRKKKNKQTGSGMTGTRTNSKTMTKSGTTKQGTTTGTFQKTGTVGTGGTGNTTTGGQRY